MQFGRFFSIDKNSIVEEGKIVFRYLRVVSERNPILPIYLSLKPNKQSGNYFAAFSFYP